jgi:hypothetical protein
MSPDYGDGAKLDSSVTLSGASPEKQNEKVEKPDTDCRYSCWHIGPGGGAQNLLNPCYLLVASNNTVAHQQFLRPRTGIELHWQSEEGKDER